MGAETNRPSPLLLVISAYPEEGCDPVKITEVNMAREKNNPDRKKDKISRQGGYGQRQVSGHYRLPESFIVHLKKTETRLFGQI